MSQILCVGNLPKFMHAKLDGELKKFFHSCGILKVHLLTGQKFCFIEFNSVPGVNDAKKLISAQAFLGKVLRVEKDKNPSEFVDPSELIGKLKSKSSVGKPAAYGDMNDSTTHQQQQQQQHSQQAQVPQKQDKRDDGTYCLE